MSQDCGRFSGLPGENWQGGVAERELQKAASIRNLYKKRAEF
jgi:hypothetical protein